jgi:hypothetical protein
VEDEDEVQSVCADVLGALGDLLGGPQHRSILLQPLARLLVLEEGEARTKALQTADSLIRTLNLTQLQSHVLPLLQQLFAKDWYNLCY